MFSRKPLLCLTSVVGNVCCTIISDDKLRPFIVPVYLNRVRVTLQRINGKSSLEIT
jgi:hypothetical protein